MALQLEGIFPAVITPFDDDGALNLGALRANIHRWNQYGLHGYLVAGSTGESPFLTDDERLAVIKTVKNTMVEGMLLLAGTGRESTAHTIEACVQAAKAGADAALVVTPSFYRPLMSPAVLERHYHTVANASPIPVLLYNMPAFTGVNIALETVLALAEHPNIIGLKDSSGNSQFFAAAVRQTPADFAVFSGNLPTFAQSLISGGSGGILAVANVAPEICVALYRAAQAQNFVEVQELHNLLQPIWEVVGGSYAIGGLKFAMNLLGYAAGVPRPPLLSPSAEQQQKIKETLQSVGLL